MHPDYMEEWKDTLNQLQKPFREMMELNVKALQKVSYLKPDELSRFKKPEDILEKNVNIFIQNSHKALDYMEQAFGIFEKHLLTIARNIHSKQEKHHYH